jgi:hypothetical protein
MNKFSRLRRQRSSSSRFAILVSGSERGYGRLRRQLEAKSVPSPLPKGRVEKMGSEADKQGASGQNMESGMSDEQIKIFAMTLSNVSEALSRVSPSLADRIRGQQEDVADKRREAQVNEDLLRLRVR